jgi:hypothetical protein
MPVAIGMTQSVIMNDQSKPVYDPQDLERLLVSRELAGDVDGMVALYEPHAVLDYGAKQLVVGREAIREFYAGMVCGRAKVRPWRTASGDS